MRVPAFIGGSYESQAATAANMRTINWYLERIEVPGGTTQAALYPTPGVTTLATGTSNPGRAHFFEDDREFAVIGTIFYEIDTFGALTNRGTVALDSNPATISSNGDGGGQLFITSGSNGYNFNLSTNTLSQIAALNGKATMGDHLDGYFLALDTATSTLYISALLDGTSWTTGIDFAQRSIASDPWVSLKVNGRYIVILGEVTSEVWYNTGASFPFAPHPSGLIRYGCLAPFSVAVGDAQLYWLGATSHGDGYVLRMGGFTPEVVSNFATQKVFNDLDTPSDAQAYTYSDLGHTFYVLNFQADDQTWAYDANTGIWAERGTWISENNEYIAWRPRWHARAFNEHRILDAASGVVYRMGTDLLLDVESRPIRRLRRSPALVAELEDVFYSVFELDLEPGLGTVSGQGADPQVMLRFSNDGGKTWSSEIWRAAGKIGRYEQRVRWTRLGMGRRRVWEVSVTDPIPWRLTEAYVELAQPPSVQQQQGAA